MSIEDLDERNAYNTDSADTRSTRDADGDEQGPMPLPGGCLFKVLGLIFMLYIALYFVMFKWLGERIEIREYYFQDHELAYAKDIEISDFPGELDALSDFIYTIYNPLINVDGSTVELSASERSVVMAAYKTHCAKHAQEGVLYICTYEADDHVWLAEYGFWGFGEEWYVDLAP